MTRLVSKLPLAIAVALAPTIGGIAHAETQAEIAARYNEEGKQLMYTDQPAEAAKKFQEAIANVPEARYFVNLCTAQLGAGLLSEALTACESVKISASATPDQKAKAEKLIERINEEAAKQKLVLKPAGGGGGDQNVGQGGTGAQGQGPSAQPTGQPQPPQQAPVVGRPLGQSLVMSVPPSHRYTWTLGIDLVGGPARVGRKDWYGSFGAGLRIKSDFLLSASQRFGLQTYFQYNQLSTGDDQMELSIEPEKLDVVDFGLALYKHICLGGTPRLCITPLGGAHLTMMGPGDGLSDTGEQLFDYSAVGARGEVSLAYAFGSRYEHVLALSGGVNLYSRVLSGPSTQDIEDAGLDKGGFIGYFGLGYTYRFNTPLGSSPFITLE